VAVSLSHDGRETFSTTGRGDLQAALLAVYGREVAESMISVESAGEDLPPGPLGEVSASDTSGGSAERSSGGVSGYVSHPETNRSSREYVSTYVNGRYVTASAVREAVLDAYGGQLAADRYPFVVLFLDVPPADVDVNVHPRKMEARFEDEAGLRRQVEAAVEDALLDHGLVRSNAPRGRSAPDEATVEPDSTAPDDGAGTDAATAADPDGTTDGDVDLAEYADAGGRAERNGDPSDAEAGAATDGVTDAASPVEGAPTAEETQALGPSSGDAESTAADEANASADAGTAASADHPTPDGRAGVETEPSDDEFAADTSATSSSTADTSATSPSAADASPSSHTGGDAASPSKFGGDTDQRTLAGDSVDRTREYDSLPAMRVLGQFSDTYVVAETETGLALVDQHAADERVNYERLREAFAGDTTAQSLAQPVELELTAGEAALFEEYADALASLGFYATRADDRTVEVTTVPAVFDETLDPARLRDVLASFVSTADEASGRETVESLADEFIADLACYPSVTGNTSLTEGAVTELLAALDDCENPYACPHGRPVVVELDEDDLAERFERDYPGHGGRRET
jgi:DNA mismatch repair protein MutL